MFQLVGVRGVMKQMAEQTEYYTQMLEKGLEFQDFACKLFYDNGLPLVMYNSQKNQLSGENMAGIEIKFDDKMHETGNLFIEVSEKTNPANPNYVPSGIFRKDNSWLYAIGNYTVIYLFSKKRLRKAYALRNDNGEPCYFRIESGIKTSWGFLFPVDTANQAADKILRPKQKIERVK